MRIEIFKQYSKAENCYEYKLNLKDKITPITFSLRRVIIALLSFDNKLTVKNCYFPFRGNCIGIKPVISCATGTMYIIIYSDFSDIKIGTEIVMCDKVFKEAIGWFRYTFYKSFYFSIN